MLLNKKMYFVFFALFGIVSSSWAQPAAVEQPIGVGKVNMRGAILDAACSIDLGDAGQSISLDNVRLADGLQNRQEANILMHIQLTNCVFTQPYTALMDRQKFKITFDGLSDGVLFDLSGGTSEVALKITDSFGQAVIPGQALPLGAMAKGDMGLNYSITLINQGQHSKEKFGRYMSNLNLKLDYF